MLSSYERLAFAIGSSVKCGDVTADQAKIAIPYIVKTVTDGKFSSLEDMYALLTLLGEFLVRYPGTDLNVDCGNPIVNSSD